MNTKSKYLIAVSMLVAGTVFLGATQTFATDSFDRYPNFLQRLVQRFSLKESDVKSFFDEERNSRQKEMSTKYESILNQAIKDGKLTEDQKTALIAWSKDKGLDTKYLMGKGAGHGMRGFKGI